VWLDARAAAGGTFTASGIDDDGDLADCPIDPATAQSVATYKGATRRLSATLTPPVHDAMMYLAYGASGPREIKINGSCRIFGDLCAEKVQLASGTPDHRGNIYAKKLDEVSPGLDDADTNVYVYASEPERPTVDVNWLVARGSQMSPGVYADDYYIADKVISPTSNPYGFSNANGIYYITGDRETRFVRCYINATIVILTNKKVSFEKASVHAPAFPYYPALVMEDELHYSFDQNLSEAESDVDFNRDGDKSDVFTPSVSGVVSANKKIFALQYSGGTNIVRFKGVFISDYIEFCGSGGIFEQDPSLATDLVNQFEGDGLQLVPGSVRME